MVSWFSLAKQDEVSISLSFFCFVIVLTFFPFFLFFFFRFFFQAFSCSCCIFMLSEFDAPALSLHNFFSGLFSPLFSFKTIRTIIIIIIIKITDTNIKKKNIIKMTFYSQVAFLRDASKAISDSEKTFNQAAQEQVPFSFFLFSFFFSFFFFFFLFFSFFLFFLFPFSLSLFFLSLLFSSSLTIIQLDALNSANFYVGMAMMVSMILILSISLLTFTQVPSPSLSSPSSSFPFLFLPLLPPTKPSQTENHPPCPCP